MKHSKNSGSSETGKPMEGYKVKLQVLSELDANRLDSVLLSQLIQVLLQRVFVLDTPDGYLRSHNLVLRLRHNQLKFPSSDSPNSYHISLSNLFLGDNYTIRLSQEEWSEELFLKTVNKSMEYQTESPLLQELLTEHPSIFNRLRILYSFENRRKTFAWDRLLLELDQYTFEYGGGYQLQFRPLNSSIESTSKVIDFLLQHEINTAPSNLSKVGLLFTRQSSSISKPEPCCNGTDPSCPFKKSMEQAKLVASTAKSVDRNMNMLLEEYTAPNRMNGKLAPEPYLPTSTFSSDLTTFVDSSQSFASGPSNTLDANYNDFPAAYADMEDLGKYFQFNNETSIASGTAATIITTEPVSYMHINNNNDNGMNSLGSSPSSSSATSPPSMLGKSLSTYTIKSTTNSKANSPMPGKTKSLSDKPGLTPEALTMLQKKRSCEASARYRRKKQGEQDTLRKRVAELEEENQRLKRDLGSEQQRSRILQAQLDVIMNVTKEAIPLNNSN